MLRHMAPSGRRTGAAGDVDLRPAPGPVHPNHRSARGCLRCDRQGLLEPERRVRVRVGPLTPEGTVIEVPLEGLGIHDFFLRLEVVVRG
ncbi:MAG TPA: hypothetical protein VIW03_16740 [Anaeromyxobacter sp.]